MIKNFCCSGQNKIKTNRPWEQRNENEDAKRKSSKRRKEAPSAPAPVKEVTKEIKEIKETENAKETKKIDDTDATDGVTMRGLWSFVEENEISSLCRRP